MSGGASLEVEVRVPLWVALYAIRYGQHRSSYASTEAVGLAERFWDVFPRFVQEGMVLDWVEKSTPGPWAPPAEVGRRWDALRLRLEVAP